MDKKSIEILPFRDTFLQATYKQIEFLRSFENFTCKMSKTQFLKRLDTQVASKLIDRLKAGEEIELKSE